MIFFFHSFSVRIVSLVEWVCSVGANYFVPRVVVICSTTTIFLRYVLPSLFSLNFHFCL
jgi:hypothetical protein